MEPILNSIPTEFEMSHSLDNKQLINIGIGILVIIIVGAAASAWIKKLIA